MGASYNICNNVMGVSYNICNNVTGANVCTHTSSLIFLYSTQLYWVKTGERSGGLFLSFLHHPNPIPSVVTHRHRRLREWEEINTYINTLGIVDPIQRRLYSLTLLFVVACNLTTVPPSWSKLFQCEERWWLTMRFFHCWSDLSYHSLANQPTT